MSGALQGVLEATGRTTEEKNRLCPPTVMPHTPFDYLHIVLAGISTEMRWGHAPELQEWIDRSRLNLLSGLDNEDRATVRELQGRFFAALPGAFDRLKSFAQQATPRERARIFG